MTTPVTSNSAASSAGASSAATGSATAAQTQDKFLNLLVAQLKNQDPLNPMDNAQVTSQLAQINTVDGIEKLNTTLQSLLGSYSTSQAMQASSLVGHDVVTSGNVMDLAGGSAVAGFELDGAADQVSVTITAPNGQIVHQATLANMDAGVHTFQWDGMNDAGVASAAGRYTFAVKAVAQNTAIAASPLTISRVDSVANGTSGTTLNTATGAVAWGQVKQVM
jgi:flagellar basal-body rod modification protein FlgD